MTGVPLVRFAALVLGDPSLYPGSVVHSNLSGLSHSVSWISCFSSSQSS